MHGATTVVMTAVLQEGHRRDDEAGDDCASDSDGSGPRSPPTLSDERFEMSPSKSGRAPRLSPSKPGKLLESTVEVEIPPRPVLESEPATAAVAVKPLTAVQVKMERLRQLREKRRLLEIKLQRGGGADGGAESRRDVRSTLLGLSGGSQVSSAGPASNDGGHLGLCRIPRRFQPSGVGRLQGITSNQDKELDRITRLNTARNRCRSLHLVTPAHVAPTPEPLRVPPFLRHCAASLTLTRPSHSTGILAPACNVNNALCASRTARCVARHG